MVRSLTRSQRVQQKLGAAYGKQCLKCGKDQPPFHVDHVISCYNGGRSVLGNYQLLCHTCNIHKKNGNKDYRPDNWQALLESVLGYPLSEDDLLVQGISTEQDKQYHESFADLVDTLCCHIADLHETIDSLQGQTDEIRDLLNATRERDDQAEEIGRLKYELEKLTSTDVKDTRPWWKRWFGA